MSNSGNETYSFDWRLVRRFKLCNVFNQTFAFSLEKLHVKERVV